MSRGWKSVPRLPAELWRPLLDRRRRFRPNPGQDGHRIGYTRSRPKDVTRKRKRKLARAARKRNRAKS